MKSNEQKTPLGLMPRAIWEEKTLQKHAKERKAGIVEAIKRYLDDGKVAIPQEWIREYNEILAEGGASTTASTIEWAIYHEQN